MCIAYLLIALFVGLIPAFAQSPSEPLGIALEGYPYPFPVRFLPLTVEQHSVRLAYINVQPTTAANGRTVLLMPTAARSCSCMGATSRPLTGSQRSGL